MLSAFQARRARLQPEHNVPKDQPDTVPSPSGSDDSFLEPKPIELPSKRKPRQRGIVQNNDKTHKRKRKPLDAYKKTRYFNLEVGLQQESPVTDDPDEDLPMSELDDDQLTHKPDMSTRMGTRAWSPSQPIRDSSGDESSDSATQAMVDDPHPVLPDQGSVPSSLIPQENINTFVLSQDEVPGPLKGPSSTVLLIPESQSVAFIGVYSLTVLKGSLSICGVQLGASMTAYRIFAPRSSPIPVLDAVTGVAQSADLNILPRRIKTVMSDHHVVLLVQELRTGIEGLGRVIRTFEHVFRPLSLQTTPSISDLCLPGVYLCSHQDRDVQPLILPIDWANAMASLCSNAHRETNNIADDLKPVICFVKGPKNSGKSTFARILVNRLMARYRKVAFLDCDVGQSEFMPSGLVTLNVISEPIFGQPFTHPSIPYASHFIGSSTPRNSPLHYLTAVQALIQTYRLDVQYPIDGADDGDGRMSDIIPLVINTMGWTKGLGADLNTRIEELIEPTDVFQLGLSPPQYPTRTKPAPSGDVWKDNDKRVHPLSAIAPNMLSTRYTPAEHRALSMLSYFHVKSLAPGISSFQPQWETTLPLCAIPPYEVDIKTGFDQVILQISGMEDIVQPEVHRILNGAIVAFVEDQNAFSKDEVDESAPATIPYTQGSPPPSPLTSNCIGLGLIRSLSPAQMHIITPVPPHLLAYCRVLVKGEVELPIWGMLDFRSENDETVAGIERSNIPYLKWGKGEGLGDRKKRVRRNLMRRGQQ